MTECTVDGCERAVNARGLCHTHYMSARRHGVLEGYQPRSRVRATCWCGQPARAKRLCKPHYDAMLYGPLKRKPKAPKEPKMKKVKVVKEVRPKAAPKHQGPRGITKSIPMTGRVSPSPFKDGGTSGRNLDRLPDGFLSGSKRIGSYVGIKHRTYFMLHRDDDCSWIDLARCRVTDVWEHPEVGQYGIDRDTLNRATVKFCSTCDKRLAKAAI